MSAGFSRVNGPRKVSMFKTEPQLLYILVPEGISHHFFHSLFFRSESLNPAYTQGKENTDLLPEGKNIIECVYMLFSSPTEV